MSGREYNLTRWTQEEFKAAREELGLTVRDLAHILNMHPDTIRKKWEAPAAEGGYPPNPTAVAAMLWFQGGFRPPEWPQHLLDQEAGRAA